MKHILGRDDLLLQNHEYDALERASVIVARIAAYQPTQHEMTKLL